MKSHGHIEILNEAGERVKALAPVIVSASRATDIPAFFCRGSSTDLTRGTVYGEIHTTAKIHM